MIMFTSVGSPTVAVSPGLFANCDCASNVYGRFFIFFLIQILLRIGKIEMLGTNFCNEGFLFIAD